LKFYYPNDSTGLFASLLQDKRVRTAIPSDTKLSEIVAKPEDGNRQRHRPECAKGVPERSCRRKRHDDSAGDAGFQLH
jgi:hypothetical protein